MLGKKTTQNYLHPPLLRGGFKKEDRKVRQTLQRKFLSKASITVKTGSVSDDHCPR